MTSRETTSTSEAASRESGARSLAAHQHELAAALAGGDAGADVLQEVVPGGTLDVAGAFAVYRNGYLARLSEQLGETYPAVWQVLGDSAWFALCEAYIAAHRSRSYNLSDYGRELPAFLAGREPARAWPFLPELARFELAFHDLFHAPAHRSVAASELASLGDLTGVRFRLGASVRTIRCERAVYDVFRHRHDAEPPQVDVERAQHVVLFKRGTEVLGHEVDQGTFAALEAFAAGAAVEVALAAALACDETFGAPEVAKLFETMSRFGLIESVER